MMFAESEILDAGILIVDDQESNVVLLEQTLREGGYTRIASTMNPEEVCALHRENAYDLILLDLQMPRMNGIDAARIIRTLPGREAVPILALTANAFTGDRQKCIDAGMNDHIGKPVDPDQLFATLLKWLSKPI